MSEETKLPADRIEQARKYLGKGYHLQRIKMHGREYARMRKYGERDVLLGPWGPDFDGLREELPPPRVGRPRAMAPEARADQTVASEVSAEMAKAAKREVHETLDRGFGMKPLERAAETFGYPDVKEYMFMLHRRYVGEQIAKRRPRDFWNRFKETAYACMLAQAAGVNINPDLVTTMYFVEKIGGA